MGERGLDVDDSGGGHGEGGGGVQRLGKEDARFETEKRAPERSKRQRSPLERRSGL